MSTIPVIDFSKLDGEDRTATMAQIENGCQEWGFFQLVNHGVSEELLGRVKKVSSEFFKVEREEKFKELTPVKLLDELLKKDGSHADRLENMDWEDALILTDDTIQWPSQTPGFTETMKEYRYQLKILAEKLTEVMDENLGLARGYINKAFNGGEGEDSAIFSTKVSYYPPCMHPEAVNGLRAHTDAGGIILLFQDDTVKGLQVLKAGRWIDVEPLPNAIVINTGDQIEVLSNGRYKSVWHRVLVTSEGTRRSIASFYNPSSKATIAPAPQLVETSENGPKKGGDSTHEMVEYPKFVFGDYMSVYVEQKFLPKEPRFQAMRTK